MNKSFSVYKQIRLIVVALIVVAIFVIILAIVGCNHKAQIPKGEILLASEVGITKILNEKIVSAKFDSLIPNFINDCKDVSDIRPLLDTLGSATFLPADKPREPISWLELVYIETDKAAYTIGVIDGFFVIKIAGEYNYYECSARDNFLRKLYEIQGRTVRQPSNHN